MQEYTKQIIAKWMLSTILEASARKNIIFWNHVKNYGPSFEESLRGGKLVKKLEIFWVNNRYNNIIEFSFHMMWRIMLILEALIHLGHSL